MIKQKLTLATTAALGALWSSCLAGTGLYTLDQGLEQGRSTWVWAGIAGIAAGNLVLVEVVLERLVPGTPRRVQAWFVGIVAAAMAAALGVAGATWISGMDA